MNEEQKRRIINYLKGKKEASILELYALLKKEMKYPKFYKEIKKADFLEEVGCGCSQINFILRSENE